MNGLNLSPAARAMCRMGPFELKDMDDFVSDIAGLIEKHGELDVIERCHIARTKCLNAEAAVAAVLAYYNLPAEKRAESALARKAMSLQEHLEARARPLGCASIADRDRAAVARLRSAQ